MKTLLVTSLALVLAVASVACGSAGGGDPSPAHVQVSASNDGLVATVGEAQAIARHTSTGVVIDYSDHGAWVGRYALVLAPRAGGPPTLEVATPDFDRTVTVDAATHDLAGALDLSAPEFVSMTRLTDVRAVFLANAAAIDRANAAMPPVDTSLRPRLECSTNCCQAWDNATQAYLSGNTLGGAFWEWVAGRRC